MHPNLGVRAASKADDRARQTRSTEPESPEVIDLSSPSWEAADTLTFADSTEREVEREAAIQRERGEAPAAVVAAVNTIRNKSKSSRHDNASFAKEGTVGKKEAGRERDRPSAPLTSISALFGGGAKGNSNSSATARAGTKRPRASGTIGATTTQGRMRVKPPLPPPPSTPTSSALGAGAWGEASRHRRNRHAAAGAAAMPVAVAPSMEDKLWPDKHRPRDLSSLAVHAKKVDETRHWMEMALDARPDSGTYRLLALVGPPGSAKSTMVRLLAQDMGVEIAEWQDTSGQGGPAYRPLADGPALAGDRLSYDFTGRSSSGGGGSSSYQSSLDSFEEFLKRSSSYRALPMISVESTRLRGGELRNGNKVGSTVGAAAVSSACRSWTDDDYDDGGNNGAKGRGGVEGGRRIVLIEDLPSAFSDEKRARLRRLVAECARSSPCPVVLIWSQASESSSYQSQLEQVLSRETLRLPGVQVTTCNPINATLLRQQLRAVLTLEGVSDPGGTLVESAIATCRGDIRHALLSLQMAVLGPGSKSNSLGRAEWLAGGARCDNSSKNRRTKRSVKHSSRAVRPGCDIEFDASTDEVSSTVTAAGTAAGTGTRDTFLSQFHALGKLLHAKRLPADGEAGGGKGGFFGNPEGSGRLGFVPEEVLSQGGMDLDWALSFLQCHCVDFFTDDDDLSAALGYLSDADVFASRGFHSSKGGGGVNEQDVFPHRYAESIASRATAVTNKHPAKNRMRTFGAPMSYEVRRRQTQAKDTLRRFVGDAWDAAGGDVDALWASSRHLKETVDTELLPAARLLTGEWEAESALRSLLHRFVGERHGARGGGYGKPPLHHFFTSSSSPENAVDMQGGPGNETAVAAAAGFAFSNGLGIEEIEDVVDEIGEF